MKRHDVGLAILTLAFCAIGQASARAQRTFPSAHAFLASNFGAARLFGQSERLQLVAADARGKSFAVTQCAFRRGVHFQSSPPHGFVCTIHLGAGDMQKLSTSFDANFSQPPTLTLDRRTVLTPNWTAPSTALPAPFDFTIKLDRVYLHRSTHDLVLDIRYDAAARGPGLLARAAYSGGTTTMGVTKKHGKGCSHANATMGTSLSFSSMGGGSGSALQVTVYGAPPASLAYLLLGATNPDATIPGLCSKLLSSAEHTMLIGATDSHGVAQHSFDTGPYSGAAALQKVWAQGLVADPARSPVPVALGNGVHLQMPPTLEGPVAIRSLWAHPSDAKTGASVRDGGLIFQTQ